MTCSPETRIRKRWLILANPGMKAEFALSDDNWESLTTSDIIGSKASEVTGKSFVRLFPDTASIPENNYIEGQAPDFEFTGGGITFHPTSAQRVLKVDIEDGRKEIYDVVRRITNLSSGSSYTRLRLVTLIDFVYPEDPTDPDSLTIDGERATIRRGRLLPSVKGAALGTPRGAQYTKEGFSLQFAESKLRMTL